MTIEEFRTELECRKSISDILRAVEISAMDYFRVYGDRPIEHERVIHYAIGCLEKMLRKSTKTA